MVCVVVVVGVCVSWFSENPSGSGVRSEAGGNETRPGWALGIQAMLAGQVSGDSKGGPITQTPEIAFPFIEKEKWQGAGN